MHHDLTWLLRNYDNLSKEQLYNILQLRSEVFVVEQDCVYQDIDYHDQDSWHLLCSGEKKLMAYARILPPGLHYEEVAIGRVVTHPDTRGTGLGKLLMKHAISACEDVFGKTNIRIEAQTHLIPFYSEFGFTVESESYLLDGIPHTEMLLKRDH